MENYFPPQIANSLEEVIIKRRIEDTITFGRGFSPRILFPAVPIFGDDRDGWHGRRAKDTNECVQNSLEYMHIIENLRKKYNPQDYKLVIPNDSNQKESYFF